MKKEEQEQDELSETEIEDYIKLKEKADAEEPNIFKKAKR